VFSDRHRIKSPCWIWTKKWRWHRIKMFVLNLN